MSASPPTLRGFVAGDGAVLLKQAPADWPAHWLADVLRQLADCEVLITVTVVGQGRPDWLPTAMHALERPLAQERRPLPAGWAPSAALGPGARHGD